MPWLNLLIVWTTLLFVKLVIWNFLRHFNIFANHFSFYTPKSHPSIKETFFFTFLYICSCCSTGSAHAMPSTYLSTTPNDSNLFLVYYPIPILSCRHVSWENMQFADHSHPKVIEFSLFTCWKRKKKGRKTGIFAIFSIYLYFLKN